MVLGAIGTVALASPASATYSRITYDVKCGPRTGTAVISWTVENEVRSNAVVSDLSRTLDGIANGDTIEGLHKVTGTEVVVLADLTNGIAKLELTLTWGNRSRAIDQTADLAKITCAAQPTAEFTDKCDKSMVVKVTNPGPKTVKIAVNAKEPFVERFDLESGASHEVTVPAEFSEHVRVKFPGGDQIADHKWTAPEVCYTVSHKSTCDKLTITVKNDGTEALRASVAVGGREEPKDIPAGQSATATFDAADGLVVKLTVGKKSTDIKYEKPSDCTPLLPKTGVNAGLLAGAAFVLVSGGAGLYFLARRRRVRFAA